MRSRYRHSRTRESFCYECIKRTGRKEEVDGLVVGCRGYQKDSAACSRYWLVSIRGSRPHFNHKSRERDTRPGIIIHHNAPDKVTREAWFWVKLPKNLGPQNCNRYRFRQAVNPSHCQSSAKQAAPGPQFKRWRQPRTYSTQCKIYTESTHCGRSRQ